MSTIRIAFLHLAPCLRDLQANRRLIERAVTTAATYGATWVLRQNSVSVATILPTTWAQRGLCPLPIPGWPLCQRAARLGVTVFLSHPERDGQSGKCYNTLFVIAADGRIVGKHRKIHTLSGAEGWSSPGEADPRSRATRGECRVADMRGCLYPGDCHHPQGPGSPDAGLGRGLGTRPAWP